MEQHESELHDEGELPPEPSIPSSDDDEGEDFARGLPWESREQINMTKWLEEHDRRISKWVNLAAVDKKEHSDALARQLYMEMRAEAKAQEDLRRRRRRHDRRERGDRGNESDRITELECDNVDEAGCYNYTEKKLTRTQIRFVQEHLKNAHESFVVHHSNRHNYGKVALMDLSEDAYVEPETQAVSTAMTRAKSREASQLLQWFRNWKDPDGLNKAILEKWDTKRSNDPWYARATKNSTQGGGAYAESQALGAQVRLIVEIFKSYKKAAAWWNAYKSNKEFPATKDVSSDEYKLREGIVKWLINDASVTYETTNRTAYLKVARVLWEFMDTISDYLDANQVDYEAEKTKWGTYDGADASEQRLDKLLGKVTEKQEVARDSETRAALRAKVKDVEALIAKTEPGSRTRQHVKEIVEGPLDDAKRLLQEIFSDPTGERTQRKKLHLRLFSALRHVAGNTSEQLEQHFQRQKACALALIREIEDIGYQNKADTPEYVELVQALRTALERRKQGALLSATDDAYVLVWSLHRAYDHAFAAVYGDSTEVGAFKSAFEERAVARANEGSVTEGADHEGHAALARVVQRRRQELKADLDAVAGRAF